MAAGGYSKGCLIVILLLLFTGYQYHYNNFDPGAALRYSSRHRMINRHFTAFDKELSRTFERLVSQSVDANDKELVSLVSNVIDGPADHQIKVRTIPKTTQAQEVLKLLRRKVGL